jgi:hypothetical protein
MLGSKKVDYPGDYPLQLSYISEQDSIYSSITSCWFMRKEFVSVTKF